jgi:hypothetical protein
MVEFYSNERKTIMVVRAVTAMRNHRLAEPGILSSRARVQHPHTLPMKSTLVNASVYQIILLLLLARVVHPIICNIGYGQRGLKYQNEIIWRRNCVETTYCFEAVTSDIEKMKPLIDYPWVRAPVITSLTGAVHFSAHHCARYTGPVLPAILRKVLWWVLWNGKRLSPVAGYSGREGKRAGVRES